MSKWITPFVSSILLVLPWCYCDGSAGKGEIMPSSPLPPQECQACPPGFGVTRVCDLEQDTQCAPCPTGSYNSKPTKDSPCQTCDTCPENFYEWTPCSGIVNTVCASCEKKPQGSGNENYLEKCERTTTPPPLALIPSSTVSIDGEDHPEFISTKGEQIFTPDEDGGSGDIDVDEDGMFSPNSDKKGNIMGSTPVDTTAEDVGAGKIIFEENQPNVSESSFAGWPILLAALIAALICFVIGLTIRVVLKRKKKNYDVKKDPNDPEVQIAMVPNGTQLASKPPLPEERTPIYTGDNHEKSPENP